MTSVISLLLSPITSLLGYIGRHLKHFLNTPMTSKPDSLTYREALFLYTIRWYCMYTPMNLLFPVPLFKALGVVAALFFDTNVQYVEPADHPFKGYWYDNTHAKQAKPDHPAYRRQHSETAGPTPRVMLFMHGGALISGTSRQYPYIFNYFINEARQRYNVHLRILSVEYTLLNQKTKYEGAVNEQSINECMHAYDYLLQQCHVPADEIIFCGDSCGGQLALLLALLCRDGQSFVSHKAVNGGKNGQQQISTEKRSNGHGSSKSQSRPMPRCIVTGSPWVDVSKDLLGKDDVCRDFFTRKIAVAWDDWHVGQGGDSHNPLLSPLHASLRMPLPPMFICYGKKEMLRTSIEHFVAKARKSGVAVTEYADERLFHIFPFVSDFIGPNGFKALDQMIQYMFTDRSHSKMSPHSTHVN